MKDKEFKIFTSITSQELDTFCTALLVFHATLDVSIKKGQVDQYTRLQAFIQHCCHQRHYFFDILKCGKSDYDICRPVRLPAAVFQQLNHLPDSTLSADGYFLVFWWHIWKINYGGTPTISQSKENEEVTASQCQQATCKKYRHDVTMWQMWTVAAMILQKKTQNRERGL